MTAFNAIPGLRGTIALVLSMLAAPASALTITTGSYLQSGLGAEFATPYDTFAIAGASTVVATPYAPIDVTIASYSFEVGPNCYACTSTPSFDALIDITVDGVTRQLDLPYSWSSAGPNDYLTFAATAPIRFDLGAAGMLTLAVDPVGMLGSAPGRVGGDLRATLLVSSVPEPNTSAMLVAGLTALGFVAGRRRKR
jgi:hypothetical protein